MLNSLVEKIISLLPYATKNKVRAYLSRSQRAAIIRNWENSGRPFPPPHEFKQTVIEHYQSASGCNVLVETGTYLGDMVEAQRKNFRKIYSIELSEKLYAKAVQRFKNYPHIQIIQGDSAKVLEQITGELKEPALFWLDGHYSAGITARGEKDCPVFGELDAIFRFDSLKHILLIDDARCFNGEGDYPTIEALTTYIKSKQPAYEVEVKDDIIRFTIK